MADFILTQIINYGSPFVGIFVFTAALGVPIPATLVVIAAGAFSRQGLLAWHTTGLIALTCAVLADCIGYGLGYYARRPVLRRFGSSERWQRAERFFQHWGGMSVFLTRFLITGIASPVNIIAGTSNLRFRTFFIFDLTGEAIWIFGYGGLGYLFGSQWEAVSDFLSDVSGFLLGVVILIIGVWLAVMVWRRNEVAKRQVPED